MRGGLLLPCPYCGRVDTLDAMTRQEGQDCEHFETCEVCGISANECAYPERVAIVCNVLANGCGAGCGYQKDLNTAISAWNTRAGNFKEMLLPIIRKGGVLKWKI